MRVRNILKVALAAIYRNKTRSLLTSLGIIIGVASVILLVSIGSGIRSYITSSFEDLGTNLLYIMPGQFEFRDSREGGPPGVATNKLTLKIAEKLDRANHVIAVVPILTSNATAEYKGETYNTFFVGVTANYEEVRNSPVSKGKFFNESDVRRGARVAILGTTVVEELFNTNNPVGQTITISDKRYTVIGVLDSKGAGLGNDQDDQILVPITTIQKHLDSDKLSYIYVSIDNTDNIAAATRSIEQIVDRDLDEDEYSVVNSEELLSTVGNILNILTLGLGGIAAISLVVGGIGIMNIMLVSVTERTREIGLRKAVGARPKDILIQFLIEAIVLSVSGGIIGIIIGALGSLALNALVQTHVTLWSVALAFGFSTLIGIVFGVWPARRASKLSPINALRYE